MRSSIMMGEIPVGSAAALAAAGKLSKNLRNEFGHRRLRLRVSSTQTWAIDASIADGPMTALTGGVPITQVTGAANNTTGTGKFVDIDCGGYSDVFVTVTNTHVSAAAAIEVVGKFYDPE